MIFDRLEHLLVVQKHRQNSIGDQKTRGITPPHPQATDEVYVGHRTTSEVNFLALGISGSRANLSLVPLMLCLKTVAVIGK